MDYGFNSSEAKITRDMTKTQTGLDIIMDRK